MSERDIDWDDLRILHSVAMEGSLSASARRLGVSHATVSRRLARLEEVLGLRLVDRMATGAILTTAGRELGVLSARMADDAVSLIRHAKGARQLLSGEVVVAVTPGLANEVVVPALASLGTEHPGIVLTIASGVPLVSLDRLEADLAIRLTRPEEGSHTRRRLGIMRFALVAAKTYDPGNARRRFIGYSHRFDTLPQQHWLIEQAGSDGFAARIDDITGQRAAALSGMGIALLPEFMIGPFEDQLQRIPFDGPLPTREIWLAQHQDIRKAPAVRMVADRLAEAFERDDRFCEARHR